MTNNLNQRDNPSSVLARFASELQYDDIPTDVVSRCEDLLLDTMGSILAGSVTRPVQAMATFAAQMAPTDGPSEDYVRRTKTSPYFAAMVNAAAAHVVEQDDVHNGSVFHPAAVVFPPALAVAQAVGASGREFITACVAGYEVGIRVGEFLGRAHYKIFHTTGTAGTLAAAVTVGRLLKLDFEQMCHAIGSAGTTAAGLWEFLKDAADSKQLHTAHAAAAGMQAAYLAREGFTGASHILEGSQGMGAGMTEDADPAKLVDRLGTRWALAETSFKFHASCRHTHPAADALQAVMQANNLKADQIASVVTHVHQGAIDVLGPVTDPQTVHQSKFSMGTVLALIALRNSADLKGFDEALNNDAVAAFRNKVTMELDEEVDTAYPQRWIGKVTVTTTDGQTLSGRVDEPKGDPGNTLSRPEIEDKTRRLGTYQGAASAQEVEDIIAHVWQLRNQEVLQALLLKQAA
ncbi:MmgE/PrpD family protein [Orrella sp. 11846]|uniref:MmgE/PrpD family protein n=1 Tax=Orrella sp. 11846 TaxID=3409913 RepID=UPI003B58C1FC